MLEEGTTKLQRQTLFYAFAWQRTVEMKAEFIRFFYQERKTEVATPQFTVPNFYICLKSFCCEDVLFLMGRNMFCILKNPEADFEGLEKFNSTTKCDHI